MTPLLNSGGTHESSKIRHNNYFFANRIRIYGLFLTKSDDYLKFVHQ